MNESKRQQMFNTFQSWALQNYGDSGKTKTVTLAKYARIAKILSGEETATSENSKFRFWVKAKGFKLGRDGSSQILYIPSKSTNDRQEVTSYKRVAIVEDFFDIIYNVHVEMDGRAGKHAGQKRTYRAIAETYAFLPREAVTRFLMACSDCQKRMHVVGGAENGGKEKTPSSARSDAYSKYHNEPVRRLTEENLNEFAKDAKLSQISDPNVPFTLAYLNDQKQRMMRQAVFPGMVPALGTNNTGNIYKTEEESMSTIESCDDKSLVNCNSPQIDDKINTGQQNTASNSDTPSAENSRTPTPVKSPSTSQKACKRRASDEISVDSSSKASEATLTLEEEEEEEEEDEKLCSSGIDTQRLKAFNMFVRLFVDENLDRSVPISKQPKEKIQAILEACQRQFPEFQDRSRKRIRTYLKSCRRLKQPKDSRMDLMRPGHHLVSPEAESLLAQACENEANNAKRMRMGLDPISTAPPVSQSFHTSLPTATTTTTLATTTTSVQSATQNSTPFIQTDFTSPFSTAFANNSFFRPPFSEFCPPTQNSLPFPIQNGPTDLSLKRNSKRSLTSPEVTTIKSLVAGYRESAAFLARSADELEQLLFHSS